MLFKKCIWILFFSLTAVHDKQDKICNYMQVNIGFVNESWAVFQNQPRPFSKYLYIFKSLI